MGATADPGMLSEGDARLWFVFKGIVYSLCALVTNTKNVDLDISALFIFVLEPRRAELVSKM